MFDLSRSAMTSQSGKARPGEEARSRGECPGGPQGSGDAGICLFMQEKDFTAKLQAFHPDHSHSVQLIESDRGKRERML